LKGRAACRADFHKPSELIDEILPAGWVLKSGVIRKFENSLVWLRM
jgi:hypothetical protein